MLLDRYPEIGRVHVLVRPRAGGTAEERFFGKSIFRQTAEEARTLISNYQELGYLRHDVLTVLGPRRRAEAFRIDPRSGEATPVPLDPTLLGEGIAYYQQASRAFKTGQLNPAPTKD